jgi:hypothetical protein
MMAVINDATGVETATRAASEIKVSGRIAPEPVATRLGGVVVLEGEDTIGSLHHGRVVTRNHHRCAVTSSIRKRLEYDSGRYGVEVAGGFIGQDHIRVLDQRPAQPHSLGLAT